MSKALSQFLDAARWVAAVAVLIGHAGVIINFHDIMVAPHGPGVYLWWFIAAFWHPAVVVFFVISGFLVGGSALRRMRRPAPMFRDFYIDRVSRIYIVFLPALALGALIDSLGRTLFPNAGLYEAPFMAPSFDIRYLFTALVQQQGLWAPQFGSNGPLWSLAYEFWYYATFPLLILPLSPFYDKRMRLAGCALGVAVTLLMAASGEALAYNFLFGYLMWGFGVAVNEARAPLLRSKWASLLLFLGVVTIVRLAARGFYVEHHPIIFRLADVATAATFANLLVTLRFCGKEGFSALAAPIHRRLADFSYSLYATHAPLVFLVWSGVRYYFGQSWTDELPTLTHWLIEFALLAAALALAYHFSRFTERKTPLLRDWMQRLAARFDKTRAETEAAEV